MKRRTFLMTGAAIGTLAATAAQAQMHGTPAVNAGDGTPMQFMPKKPKDATPLQNELEKYAKCPYCGMDRKDYHFSRHLIHYSDDLVDGTCSIHCAAISLSLNLDRSPKAIYAPDNSAADDIKPLVEVEKLTYVIGGGLKPVMSKVAKTSFSSKEWAAAIVAKEGGETADFNKALTLAYANMAEDTMQIRKNREERRKKMMEQGGAMEHKAH
ncbi:MAG: twin-arginine translocation pathway signal protein [Rhodospirillales bacterium]|nr:MAG: twin-arginine translocation pathway signal protein [Rhodospirillales bacterium]